jgi:hypothetical protein
MKTIQMIDPEGSMIVSLGWEKREPAGLRRLRAQGEQLLWSTPTQNPQKHPWSCTRCGEVSCGNARISATTPRAEKIEMLIAQLKRILKLNRPAHSLRVHQ